VEAYKLPDDHVQGGKLPEPRGGWVNEFHDVWPNVEGINVKSDLQLPQPWWSRLEPEEAGRKILLTHTPTQRDERKRCRQAARQRRLNKKKNSMTLAEVTGQSSARKVPRREPGSRIQV
jgi:hypothetical protein